MWVSIYTVYKASLPYNRHVASLIVIHSVHIHNFVSVSTVNIKHKP